MQSFLFLVGRIWNFTEEWATLVQKNEQQKTSVKHSIREHELAKINKRWTWVETVMRCNRRSNPNNKRNTTNHVKNDLSMQSKKYNKIVCTMSCIHVSVSITYTHEHKISYNMKNSTTWSTIQLYNSNNWRKKETKKKDRRHGRDKFSGAKFLERPLWLVIPRTSLMAG